MSAFDGRRGRLYSLWAVVLIAAAFIAFVTVVNKHNPVPPTKPELTIEQTCEEAWVNWAHVRIPTYSHDEFIHSCVP